MGNEGGSYCAVRVMGEKKKVKSFGKKKSFLVVIFKEG